MRVAVIDLGTNTFNLLVRDTVDHEEVHAMKIPVRLGEGGFQDQLISEEAMNRGVAAITKYKTIADSLEVDAIYAFGTSALRDAKNSDVFLQRVWQTNEIRVNIISGQEEADLIYQGVMLGMDLSRGNNLIMDIGGGSTEFILTSEGVLIWSNSFQIGSSRLSEKFVVDDPISDVQSISIGSYISESLSELWLHTREYPCTTLIGSSGSFETIAQMALALRKHPHESPANGFIIPKVEFTDIHSYLLASTLEERLANPAILNMRAGMIVLASIFIDNLMKHLPIESIILSNFALKEGVFSKLMTNNLAWQES